MRSSSSAISATRASISALRHAAVLQRESEVLADRHGVVDHRKLEHLRDIALLGRQRRDVDAVEQDLAARRRDDAGNQVQAAWSCRSRTGRAAHRRRPAARSSSPASAQTIRGSAVIAAVGMREIDEVNAGHAASPSHSRSRRGDQTAGRRRTRRHCRDRAPHRAHGRARIRARPAAPRPSWRRRG